MKKHVTLEKFLCCYGSWMEYYQENHPCTYAKRGHCPDPCPVPEWEKECDMNRLFDEWWETLPENHFLEFYIV